MQEEVYEQLARVEDDHWWFRGRRSVIWALIESAALPPGGRILDAGCGTGRNLREFASLGELVGAEPSASALEFCRAKGTTNVIQASAAELPFADREFDAVFAFDVLEHVEDDGAAFAELHRVTRPGGLLVATVPAYQWLWSQHDESHDHKRRYTRRTLVAGASGAGWQPVRHTYFNSLLLPPIALVRALRRNPGAAQTDYDLTSRRMNRLLTRPMQAEAWAIRRGVRFPAGVSIGLVARA